MTICKQCKEEFTATEHWMNLCEDCYRQGRSTVVPAAESQHPALVYEREHKPDEIVPANPAHANKCITDAKRYVEMGLQKDAPKPPPPPLQWLECEHEFTGGGLKPTDMCIHCGMFKHQFDEYVQQEIAYARSNFHPS